MATKKMAVNQMSSPTPRNPAKQTVNQMSGPARPPRPMGGGLGARAGKTGSASATGMGMKKGGAAKAKKK